MPESNTKGKTNQLAQVSGGEQREDEDGEQCLRSMISYCVLCDFRLLTTP